MSTDITTRLVEAVLDYALAHYDEGWDVVTETMTEVEIAQALGHVTTRERAIAQIQRTVVDVHREQFLNAGGAEAERELEMGRQDAAQEVYEGLAPENVDAESLGVTSLVDGNPDVLRNPLGDHLPGLALDGPVCGACTTEHRRRFGTRYNPQQLRHVSVAAIRRCAQRRAEHTEDLIREQEANNDSAAELAYERYLENGGAHSASIAADLDEERRREGW